MQLSDKQLQNYNDIKKRFGFGEDDRSAIIPNSVDSGVVIFSKDPAQSSIPPKLLTVNSVEDLKQLIGMATPSDADKINYPTPLTADNARSEPSAKQKSHLNNVMRCCIAGDIDRIAESDKEMLKQAVFPMTLAAFSVEDHTVKSGEVLKLTGGTYNSFGTLTVEAGGQIECDGNAHLTCQNFIQEGTQPANNYTFNLAVPAITPAQAENGENGDDGEQGAAGDNGASCANHCKKKPGDGEQGHSGGDGGNGEYGANGINGPILQCQINNASGEISVLVGSQSGQDGGNGGNGGNGGAGGEPGSNADGKCESASAGPTGDPGHGGNGGIGGNGGDGAQLYLDYSGSPTFRTDVVTSEGGKGGTKGVGGDNNSSYDGNPGADGMDGTDPVFEPSEM